MSLIAYSWAFLLSIVSFTIFDIIIKIFKYTSHTCTFCLCSRFLETVGNGIAESEGGDKVKLLSQSEVTRSYGH